ncbi:SIR2 family protein [Polaromonas sp.]|uniref:SIR2 family protein n=1 Tax=Polaromonas sp. TaxID=1869339 RepID=UPI003BAAB59C
MSENLNQLHNNHNVYILGAGFSRLRGLPLIEDFMLKMRDALQYHSQQNRPKECAAIKAVLEFRLNASAAAYRLQIDLENIEDLFSLASASPGQLEESIKLAIAATLDYCLEIAPMPSASFAASPNELQPLSGWTSSPNSFTPGAPNWTVPAYEFIVRALMGNWQTQSPTTENTFITFNYDTLMEDSLKALGVSYSLGFDPGGKDPKQTDVRLLKLHGSVNWVVAKGSRTKVTVMENYRSVVNAGLVPQIIPPTWKKDSRGAFEAIWGQSIAALADATRVVVLGFSIPPTDLHFKYLLAAGLRENYSLREIVFVNPDPGMTLVQERCESLFANRQHNAAKLRFVDMRSESFVGQGTDSSHVWSISRPVPQSFQYLQYS